MTNEIKQEVQAPEGVERTKPRRLYRPLVDIYESDEAVVMTADVPGADENSVDITLEKNVLTVRAQGRQPVLEGYHLAYAEYECGDFERSFTVSDDIDRDGIEATVKNGVLRLTLPKSHEALAKKIAVTAG